MTERREVAYFNHYGKSSNPLCPCLINSYVEGEKERKRGREREKRREREKERERES